MFLSSRKKYVRILQYFKLTVKKKKFMTHLVEKEPVHVREDEHADGRVWRARMVTVKQGATHPDEDENEDADAFQPPLLDVRGDDTDGFRLRRRSRL